MNSNSTVMATGRLNHGSNAYILYIALTICLTVATAALVLRIYTRWIVINQVWIDDYLAIASWVCARFSIVFGLVYSTLSILTLTNSLDVTPRHRHLLWHPDFPWRGIASLGYPNA